MSITSSERSTLLRVQALRRICLRSMLSFRPFVEPICDLAREVLPSVAQLVTAIDGMRHALRDLHEQHDLHAPHDADQGLCCRAFERARDDLACTLDEVDEQGLFADLVVADLIGIEAGQESGLSLKIAPPPRNIPFLRYVTIVRRNHQAFWSAQLSAL